MFVKEVWCKWVEKESKNYKIDSKGKKKYLKKNYLHFDKKIWFKERSQDIEKVISNHELLQKHSFFPFMQHVLEVPKKTTEADGSRVLLRDKKRSICYASHFDALILGYYSYFLNEKYQEYIQKLQINDSVLAYRNDLGKCNIQFAKEVFSHIKQRKNCFVLAADISGFFDSLNHQILKENWCLVLGVDKLPEDHFKVFKTVTKYSYCVSSELKDFIGENKSYASYLDVIPGNTTHEKMQFLSEKKLIYKNKEKGIPQGSPLSAVLSNIYMINFDQQMCAFANQNSSYYRRYSDDVILVCANDFSQDISNYYTNNVSENKLKSNRLKYEAYIFKSINNQQKPKLRCFDSKTQQEKRLQYLGFEFDGESVYLRSSTLSRYYRRMKGKVKKSVKMSYSKNAKGEKIFKKDLYMRYTHLGASKRNFFTYAYKASDEMSGDLKDGISGQVANHFIKLKAYLKIQTQKRIKLKKAKGKLDKERY